MSEAALEKGVFAFETGLVALETGASGEFA